MGLLNKCWLRFDRVAWPDDVDWIEWTGPKTGEWAQWVSFAQAAGAPVLLGFHAAGKAREMEGLTDAEMIASAHAALKSMFGDDFPAPVDAQITRWSQDPFAYGS
jgi:monoamine oxidase